ncbi:hypothetical protein [Schinkia azotoformans]|uniref:hypothetical protein n=1 Tax=Schinkia azotoformans TaxID=1454 RepID=UPI002DB6752F|nr:hypothetical protein [Schinkia azotoformans]MEC1786087.1 hypothetical protein [Schinkia azotoformans]MED4420123.1 hypothetical protein [Schinkia azotoformans]
MADLNLTIGTASVTVGGQPVPNLADAVVFSATPRIIDVDLYQAANYDKRIDGWDVELRLIFDEASYAGYKLAMEGLDEQTFDDIDIIGLKDGKTHQSLRATAKEIVVHPAELPALEKEFDITIFKAVSIGTFERSFSKEKTQYEVTFRALHKTGDPTKSGNYFLIGEDDLLD